MLRLSIGSKKENLTIYKSNRKVYLMLNEKYINYWMWS